MLVTDKQRNKRTSATGNITSFAKKVTTARDILISQDSDYRAESVPGQSQVTLILDTLLL